MATSRRPIARPMLVVAAMLCAALFAYVIFTQRHQPFDQVVNPFAHPTDTQILSNTKTALPLRHQSPTQFGAPTGISNTIPVGSNSSFVVPSSSAPVINSSPGSYSNLPPVINPGRPVSVDTGPGQAVSIPRTAVTNNAVTTTTQSVAAGKPGKPPITTTTTTSTPIATPLNARPAYTVLIKSPGDRTRKAVVVNH